MKYGVLIQYYSLEAHCVGAPAGKDIVVSKHRSLKAAGRVLGSLISRKLRNKYPAKGRGVQMFVYDLESGQRWSRNQVLRDAGN